MRRHARGIGLFMKPWYRSTIWILPLAVIAVSLCAVLVFSGTATPIRTTTTALETAGPNLLRNASFSRGLYGWKEYHNAEPMKVTTRPGTGEAQISFGGQKDSVQEIYQAVAVQPKQTVVATGRIRVSGAPLPVDASAVITLVDSTDKGVTKFAVWAKNGTGSFPFAFAFTPNGRSRFIVLGVVVGKASNSRTVVGFDRLTLSLAKN